MTWLWVASSLMRSIVRTWKHMSITIAHWSRAGCTEHTITFLQFTTHLPATPLKSRLPSSPVSVVLISRSARKYIAAQSDSFEDGYRSTFWGSTVCKTRSRCNFLPMQHTDGRLAQTWRDRNQHALTFHLLFDGTDQLQECRVNGRLWHVP